MKSFSFGVLKSGKHNSLVHPKGRVNKIGGVSQFNLKMLIYLANETNVSIGATNTNVFIVSTQSYKNIQVKRSKYIPVTLTPIDSNHVDEITKLEKKLVENSSSGETQHVQVHGVGTWTVDIDVGIYCTDQFDETENPEEHSTWETKGYIRVRDSSSTGILGRLSQLYQKDELKLTVNISYRYRNMSWPNLMEITNEDVSYITRLNSYGAEKTGLNIRCDNNSELRSLHTLFMCDGRPADDEIQVTIIAVVPDNHPQIGLSIPDKLCMNKKLLLEEVCTDVTIIAENGVGIKCHKVHLAVHSSVFSTMFKTTMQEAQTDIVEMPDMCEAVIRAFLAYLYYWETAEAEKDSLICFELLAAGHKYDISQLEDHMQEILLRKGNDWYDVDVATKLFLFSRNLPNGDKLKMKAVEVLKSKRTELKTCSSCQQLFTDNPNAAFDLLNTILSLSI